MDRVLHDQLRHVDVAVMRQTVARLLVEANYRIPEDVLDGLRNAAAREQSVLGKRTLERLIQNYLVAATEHRPACQDSGMTVVHLEIGQDVHWTGGSLNEAINEGIRVGTRDGYLRWSLVGNPLTRKSTGEYSAGVVHLELTPGSKVKVTVASKGFGGENMSGLKMLIPADGLAGVKRFVIETVDRAGANSCPPVIVGVGVGGTFEKAALLAKQAVLRPIDRRNSADEVRALEDELLDEVNRLGIGPQGFGGIVTALAVNVEVAPTHIAGLPVAVNMGCHSTRRLSAEL
jgi:fumarate hydratase subunit alpha